MTLRKASFYAIKYACLNYHYSRAVPSVSDAFSVFNEKDEWCGVVCFSAGANNNICKPFGLVQGQVIELVRVALNGKQGHGRTSMVIAMSLKQVKKNNPLVSLIVSYADPEQGHVGGIYQATNWVYIGKSKAQREVIDPKTGKVMHKRTANSIYGTIKGLEKSKIMWKHKYVYPLTRKMRKFCDEIRLDYPKKTGD